MENQDYAICDICGQKTFNFVVIKQRQLNIFDTTELIPKAIILCDTCSRKKRGEYAIRLQY